ncbi:hypothetical protein [Streptomyces sp. NPDC055036]
MGHLLLMWRLILHDMRRHPGEALMFLLAVSVATAGLTLGLATNNAVTTGYLKTREATAPARYCSPSASRWWRCPRFPRGSTPVSRRRAS